MRAYVLITAEAGSSELIEHHLKDSGIERVDPVAGTYDLVAVIESDDSRRIGELVMKTIQRTPGVISTVTLMTLN
ncbi:MAG: Lrp/AsnC ligand binding domain-containing protein [Thermomicrobiales bacterium]